MTKLSPAIRKAAILVSSLDDGAAEALLETMGAEMAARVRSALVELDDIPTVEQQAVLAEFLAGRKSAGPTIAADCRGVELEVSAEKQGEPASAVQPPADEGQQPFAFLAQIPAREAAAALARESAQTIAVIIARLDPAIAAGLLAHLPPELATDALERMASLQLPAADVFSEIEQHLRLELAPYLSPNERPESLATMQALLGAMDVAARDRVLAGLRRRNGRLARQLGYERRQSTDSRTRYRMESAVAGGRLPSRSPAPLVEFEDLLMLSDETLRRVFAAADPAVVMLALTGAPESLLARILGQLPAADAAKLRKRLNHPGPVRLSDIEAAQDQLAAIARRLAEQGAIVVPGSRHFAAAA
jgi:flagellar motor switch protein FliG